MEQKKLVTNYIILADCYTTLSDFMEKFDPKKFEQKKFEQFFFSDNFS
jgi:hypothetical protein